MSRCRLSFLIVFAVLPGAAAAQPADAGAADKARAFERFCETGGCAPEGLSQSEFVARFEGSRYPALEFSGREIERFREKFLGHKKFTLEINLRLTRPDAGALSVAGRFVSWFDDDVNSLREESCAEICRENETSIK